MRLIGEIDVGRGRSGEQEHTAAVAQGRWVDIDVGDNAAGGEQAEPDRLTTTGLALPR